MEELSAASAPERISAPLSPLGTSLGACGVDYSGAWPEHTLKHQSGVESHKDGGRAFFTKNGEFLGYAFSNLHGKLYPSVGLRTPGEVVRANFGSEPFSFDIDRLVRDRKSAVFSQISSTVVPSSLLLPPPSPSIPTIFPLSPEEKLNDTLQSLVTSYLIHHGYTSTAESFASQVTLERRGRSNGLVPRGSEGEDESMEGDETDGRGLGSDSSVRVEIRKAFLKGDMERVMKLTEGKYPGVFKGDKEDPSGGFRFKLRTREFVEAVLRSLPVSTSNTELPTSTSLKGKGKAIIEDVSMEDIEEETYSTPATSPIFAPPPALPTEGTGLDVVLSLGKSLSYDFKDDERPLVRETLEEVFSLMAYSKLEELEGRLGWLVSREKREEEADELNSAILVSLSLPPIPHLEAMYRQTSAVVDLLGECGNGGAVFVDVRREMVGGLS
ncbi:Ran-binding protein 9/10, partial [Phenoliferia sp. Uapishka_3]